MAVDSQKIIHRYMEHAANLQARVFYLEALIAEAGIGTAVDATDPTVKPSSEPTA